MSVSLPGAVHELSENITIIDGEIKKDNRAAVFNYGRVDPYEFQRIEKRPYDLIRFTLKLFSPFDFERRRHKPIS